MPAASLSRQPHRRLGTPPICADGRSVCSANRYVDTPAVSTLLQISMNYAAGVQFRAVFAAGGLTRVKEL